MFLPNVETQQSQQGSKLFHCLFIECQYDAAFLRFQFKSFKQGPDQSVANVGKLEIVLNLRQ